MQPEEAKRGLLRAAINKHKKQTTKDDVQDIVNKHAINKYFKELLKQELGDYEDDQIVDRILDQLDSNGMWGNSRQQLPTYSKFELNGLIEDYHRLLRSAEPGQPFVEMQLQKCMLIAFKLKHSIPVEAISIPELQMTTDEKMLKEELLALEQLVREEKRLLGNAKVLLEKLIKEQNPTNSQGGPYETLQSLRKELKVLDANELRRLIDKANEAGEAIRNCKSNILLFIGDTGSGKTTIIKSLLGYKMGHTYSKGLKTVDVVEQLEDPVVREMYCNPGCKSVTRYVAVTKPKQSVTRENVMLADTPGFHDTAGIEVEFANIIGLKKALQEARNLRIVIIVGRDSWGSRYNGIRQLSRVVAMLFRNYRQIQDSVTIMFNNQSHLEVREKAKQISQILVNSPASDKNDENYASFISHLHQVTSEEDDDGNPQYVIYDPLSNKPIPVMRKLLKKAPIKNAYGVFSDRSPSGTIVRNYCSEVGKRVKYHLEGNRLWTVKYFVDELQTLSEYIDNEICQAELRTIRELVIEVVKNQQQTVTKNFNAEILALNMSEEDCSVYIEQVKEMERSGCEWLLGKIDYQQEAEDNIKKQVQILQQSLMDNPDSERAEEFPRDCLKTASTVRTVYHGFSEILGSIDKSSTAKHFIEKADQLQGEYSRGLRTAETVSTVGGIYEKIKAVQAIRITLLQKNPERRKELLQKCMYELENFTINQISNFEERVEELLKLLNDKNISEISQIDKYFNVLKDSHTLLKEFAPENGDRIRHAPKWLKGKLNIVSDELSHKMHTVFSSVNSRKLERNDATNFSQLHAQLSRLGKVECMTERVENELHIIKNAVLHLIEEQNRTLQHFKEMTWKVKGDFFNNIRSLNSSINVIEQLVGVFDQETAEKGRELLKESLEKLPQAINKIFKSKIADNNITEEKLEKIGEACQLEEFFKRNRQRYEKPLTTITAINEDACKMLIQALNKDFSSLDAVKECNQHFAKTPKEPFTKSVSFGRVEKLMKLVDLLSRAQCTLHFKELDTKVAEYSRQAGDVLVRFKESIERAVEVFISCFMEPNKDKTSEQCQAVHYNIQRKFKELAEIETLPKVSFLMLSDCNYGSFQERWISQLDHFAGEFAERFGNPKTSENTKLVVAKCRCLQNSNNLLNDTVERLLKVKKNAEAKIEAGLKRDEQSFGKKLKLKDYVQLRRSIKTFKEKHGPDHQSLEDIVEQLRQMACYLEKDLKQSWDPQNMNLERMFEQTKDLLGLISTQSEVKFCLAPDLLNKQRRSLTEKINTLVEPLRIIDEEKFPYTFGDALIAFDQLSTVRFSMDEQIVDFLKQVLSPKDIDKLEKRLMDSFKAMQKKFETDLADRECAYGEYFTKQPNLAHPNLFKLFQRLSQRWEQYCLARTEHEIQKAKNQPTSNQRKKAFQILARRIRNYPKKMQQTLLGRLKQLEERIKTDLEAQRRRLRDIINHMPDCSIDKFRDYLRLIESEGDQKLEADLRTILHNVFESAFKLPAQKFLEFYRERLQKFVVVCKTNGSEEFRQLTNSLVTKSSTNFKVKLDELTGKFDKGCIEIEELSKESKKAQSWVKDMDCMAECLKIVNVAPHQRSDNMRSLVEDGFKGIASSITNLLNYFQEKCQSIDHPAYRHGDETISLFQSIIQVKKVLQSTLRGRLDGLARVMEGTIKDLATVLLKRFSDVMSEYKKIEDRLRNDFQNAVTFINSVRFDRDSLRDRPSKDIVDTLQNYVKELQFTETYLPLYNLVEGAKILYDSKRLQVEFNEMVRVCESEIGQLRGFNNISKYSFGEVSRMLGYLRTYETALQTSKHAKDLGAKLDHFVRSFIDDMKRGVRKPIQEGLQQLACNLITLKAIEIELPSEGTQQCSEIIRQYLGLVPRIMMEKLKGHIAATENAHCNRLLSDCQVNQKAINLQLQDCRPFLSKFPNKYPNMEPIYNRCREAFNTELEDFLRQTVAKEELDRLKNDLPGKIIVKAKQIQKLMEQGKATDGHELLGMVLAMQTIYTSYRDAENHFVANFWPHCTEILTLLLLLRICDSKEPSLRSSLGKLIPGENSHFITSIMATYLALIGYKVHVLNNSPIANSVKKRCSNELHDQLSVCVCYGTTQQLIATIYREDYSVVEKEVRHLILSSDQSTGRVRQSEKRVLLIDEAATFFDEDDYWGVSKFLASVSLNQAGVSTPSNRPSSLEPPHNKCESGWSSYLSQVIERDRKSNLEVVYGVVPHASLFDYYKVVIGLTSAFDQLASFERQKLLGMYEDRIYDIPAQKANSKPKSYGIKLAGEDYAQTLNQAIKNREINKGPMLICFPSEDEIYKFSRIAEMKNFRLLTEESQTGDVVVSSEVVLVSRRVCKGVRFELSNSKTSSIEGMHVIITFLPSSPSEAALLENCAISSGYAGSYEYILPTSSIDGSKASKESKSSLTQITVKENILKAYNSKLERYEQATSNNMKLYKANLQFLKDLSNNQVEEARFGLKVLNQSFRVKRIVIAIERSARMKSVLTKMVPIFQKFGESLSKVCQKLKGNLKISLQIASYANYKCDPKDILKYSDVLNPRDFPTFLRAISPEGELPTQAFELVMQHSIDLYADHIVVIASSPGNSAKQFDELYIGKQKKAVFKQTHFKGKGLGELIAELVKRKITVDCLYLGTLQPQYFQDLTKKTGGIYIGHGEKSIQPLPQFLRVAVSDRIEAQANRLNPEPAPSSKTSSVKRNKSQKPKR